MFSCSVCGKENPEHMFHCEEHYHCVDCETKENLITTGEGVLCHPCRQIRIDKRIAEFNGDTSYTREVVCPHCGHEHMDSWEMDDGEYSCSDCDNEFEITRDVDVTYSTSKVI